jgi:hypothetical protein
MIATKGDLSESEHLIVIGWGGSLRLVMRRLDPSHIQCEEEADPPFPDQCEELEQTMPATASPLFVFGPQGGRGVTRCLPATFLTERKHLETRRISIED